LRYLVPAPTHSPPASDWWRANRGTLPTERRSHGGGCPVFRIEFADHPAWEGFIPGLWRQRIDVRDFIQRNYTPYEGGGSFLTGPTERTRKLWEKFFAILKQEQAARAPLEIDAHTP